MFVTVVCCRPEIDQIYHTLLVHTHPVLFSILSLKIIINYMTGSFAAMVHGRQQPIARRRRRWQRRRGNFKRPVLLFGVCALGNEGQPSRGTTPLPFLAPSSERSIYAIRLFVACRQ